MSKRPPFLKSLVIVASIVLSGDSLATNEAYYWQNLAGQPGGTGNVDGSRDVARFGLPRDVLVAPDGNIFVADFTSSSIRRITPDGEVTTFAGSPLSERGSADGLASEARFSGPDSLAMDEAGNLYVTDGGNNTIRKVTPEGLVTTVAGKAGESGTANGLGEEARFNAPRGIVVDSSGNLFVSDRNNHTIRKITSDGLVTTFAGTAAVFGGSSDGIGAAARFAGPTGLDFDAAGNLLVCDHGNRTIRRLTPAGQVTTIAGTAGESGNVDGFGASARFNGPSGIAVAASGEIYIGDSNDNTLRKIDLSGFVSTLAGSTDEPGSFADGPGDEARFRGPRGVALDGTGNIIVADGGNYSVRSVTPAGETSTLAGIPNAFGHADGAGDSAQFSQPRGIVVSQDGTAFVLDSGNFSIRKITKVGVVSTFAGSPQMAGSADGVGAAARFDLPEGIAIDGDDNLYVSDSFAHTIRKVTPAGEVSTLAGSHDLAGSADGAGSAARFKLPGGVAVDGSGNVFVADTSNHTIRKISPLGVVSTFAGTAGELGIDDGVGAAARFVFPSGLTIGPEGFLYLTDAFGRTIRKIDPDGAVSTIVGDPLEPGSVDGPVGSARFTEAKGIVADPAGNLFVVAENGLTVRKISNEGIVTTIGGTPGVVGGVDGLGSQARFSNFTTGDNKIRGIAVDRNGALYLSDGGNNRITVGTLQELRITSIEASPTEVALQWSPFGDGQYKIQASGSLGSWIDLPLAVPAGQTSAVIPRQLGDLEQFYRVRPAE